MPVLLEQQEGARSSGAFLFHVGRRTAQYDLDAGTAILGAGFGLGW